jgi:multiple sugar transport system ATP-binding protein
MARVRLEQVARTFETATAVTEISFEVPDGEFWVLVGPSGCGKSTILRMVAGLEFPTTGNIWIGDTVVNQVPARQRDVAMVFQNYALYPHMTVAQNLAFGLQMRKTDPKTIQDRIQRVATSLDIGHLLSRKPRQLSGGQQQRVALGRAIARSPQVFLLDEPLSNLDAQLRDDTRAELKQLHQQFGITTLYVTHDQVEAMTLADRIVVLNQGRIQQIGTPQEIYAQPANRMVASFLGSPAMNLLRGVYEQGVFRLSSQVIPCPPSLRSRLANATGHSFELGIRPEHLQVAPLQADSSNGHGRGLASENTATLEVEVKLVEPLGRENLLRTTLTGTDPQLLNLATKSSLHPEVGEPLTLRFDLTNLAVFDASTGLALD